MMVVTYKIAGIVFRTESDIWLPFLSEDPFKKFLIDATNPDICLRVHEIRSESLKLSPPEGNEETKLMYHTGGRLDRMKSPLLRSSMIREKLRNCLENPDNVDIHIYQNWVVIIDFWRRYLDLYQFIENTPGLAKHPAAVYVEDSFTRMIASFLPLFSAILIHGAGVIRNGKSAAFLAPGEGGKTTVSGLSNDSLLLSDDFIVFKKEDGFINAHSTPLSKNTTGTCQASVGGLFMLEKAKHFQLVPIKPPDMVQCLWDSYNKYTTLPNRRIKTRMFHLFCDLCSQAPAYLMRFSKDYVDWDAIDAAMEGKVASKK